MTSQVKLKRGAEECISHILITASPIILGFVKGIAWRFDIAAGEASTQFAVDELTAGFALCTAREASNNPNTIGY